MGHSPVFCDLTAPAEDNGAKCRFIGDHSLVPARKYYSMGFVTLYPESIGHVHISESSADDVDAPLDFDPMYISKSVNAP